MQYIEFSILSKYWNNLSYKLIHRQWLMHWPNDQKLMTLENWWQGILVKICDKCIRKDTGCQDVHITHFVLQRTFTADKAIKQCGRSVFCMSVNFCSSQPFTQLEFVYKIPVMESMHSFNVVDFPSPKQV